MATTNIPIPGPSPKPLFGNILELDPNDRLKSFQRLQEEYGGIFKLNIVKNTLVVVSSHRLVDEACDEKRFKKVPNNILTQVRNGVHDGLFTAYPTVLKERVADPKSERRDLLSAMLKGRDSLTGEKMTDESIIDNPITFLIAGHETTSGMISYAIHELIRHPEEYRKVQQEVDEVVGTGPVTVQHMQKLPYISAVLRETLRLSSPIPMFSVTPIEDTVMGSKYEVKKGQFLLLLLSELHQDSEVWEAPLEFRPERMMDEKFNKLPKNAWKPFGNGMRACIGRAFAWQEALLVMALIFQNFDLSLADPNYVLEHKQTLTTKPKDLYIHAKLRDGLGPTELEERISRTSGGRKATSTLASNNLASKTSSHESNMMKMTILYGSNSGTCESMAQSLAADAPAHGYKIVKFGSLDESSGDLPKDDPNHPVVIVTASYEGQPPDNAVKFFKWIENSNESKTALKGTRFAVFGCGNHDWAQTFHRIPRLIDRRLEELGGKKVAQMGLADAAEEDMFSAFESWGDKVLWPALDVNSSEGGGSSTSNKPPAQSFKVHVSENVTVPSRRGVEETMVVSARTLTADGEPVKKHLEIRLPPGSTYKAGDCLAIMPSNPKASVLRAMRRFDVPWDEIISLDGSSVTLPTNVSMYTRSILSDFVELGQPITKKGVFQLAGATEVETDATALRNLAEDQAYASEVSAKRVSILDLLEMYPSVKLGLAAFLAMLPPMRVRQYSISSSPLSDPTKATVTYSVLSEKPRSGQGMYYGVASSFLSALQAGDPVHVAVRPSNVHFHLPNNPEGEPLILVAAGTGIAPFRGFIQERALLAGRQELAPAILYYGCRTPGRDDLYHDEPSEWEKSGVVTVRRAYSRAVDGQKKYVQDVLLENRDELHEMWEKNAKVFVCGSRSISQAVDKVALQIKKEVAENRGEDLDEAEIRAWWDGLRNVRYVADVFE